MRQCLRGDFIAIDIDITKLTETSQIVDTTHMVVMDMRNQHTIQLAERNTQKLLTDIRTSIYQNAGTLRLYHRRTAQTVIPWIPAAAHLTITT